MTQWDPDSSAERSDDIMKNVPGWDLRADCMSDPYFSVYSGTGTATISVARVLKHVKDCKEP